MVDNKYVKLITKFQFRENMK